MSGSWWEALERRKLVAEVLGTFVLVFAGTGAATINDVTGGAVTHVGVSLVFGLVVMALIYAVGDISGAHLNPAVTIGFCVARKFPAGNVLPYIASQCLGAILASVLLQLLFPGHLYDDDHQTMLGTTLPKGPWVQSFVLEIVLTAMLMWVILCVSTGAKEKGIMAGVAVGGVIALEALFAGPICGASMNPARSLAPALVSGHVEHLWVYLLAPVLGALVGVVASKYVIDEKVDTSNV